MLSKAIRIIFLTTVVFLFFGQLANAQRVKKVWAQKKIVAYDLNGNKIDSLSKNLKNQNARSKYLDQIQVDLHKVELQMQKATAEGDKETLNKEKEDLLMKRINLIEEIKDDKETLVKEYFIVAGAYKKKKNALAAMEDWKSKGYTPFRFYNKYRKWHYVCLSMHRSYRKANLKQWKLKQEGIDSWIYYWAE